MDKQSNDTRARILTTGRRLTAQQGYTGVGLGALLKQAGVPKGSFYHYFASKEAYGCALLQDFVKAYKAELATSLNHPTLNARARLLTYFDGWHQNQTSPNPEDRCLVVKLSAEVADLSPDMSRILQQGVAAIIARLADTLKEGIAEGTIAEINDPGAMAEAIYHLWLGASLVGSLSRDDAPLKAAMRATKALVPPA